MIKLDSAEVSSVSDNVCCQLIVGLLASKGGNVVGDSYKWIGASNSLLVCVQLKKFFDEGFSGDTEGNVAYSDGSISIAVPVEVLIQYVTDQVERIENGQVTAVDNTELLMEIKNLISNQNITAKLDLLITSMAAMMALR